MNNSSDLIPSLHLSPLVDSRFDTCSLADRQPVYGRCSQKQAAIMGGRWRLARSRLSRAFQRNATDQQLSMHRSDRLFSFSSDPPFLPLSLSRLAQYLPSASRSFFAALEWASRHQNRSIPLGCGSAFTHVISPRSM